MNVCVHACVGVFGGGWVGGRAIDSQIKGFKEFRLAGSGRGTATLSGEKGGIRGIRASSHSAALHIHDRAAAHRAPHYCSGGCNLC